MIRFILLLVLLGSMGFGALKYDPVLWAPVIMILVLFVMIRFRTIISVPLMITLVILASIISGMFATIEKHYTTYQGREIEMVPGTTVTAQQMLDFSLFSYTNILNYDRYLNLKYMNGEKYYTLSYIIDDATRINDDYFKETFLKDIKKLAKKEDSKMNVDQFKKDVGNWKLIAADGDVGSWFTHFGFWGVAFYNPATNTVVIGIRGTHDEATIAYDAAAVVFQWDTRSMIDEAHKFMQTVHTKLTKDLGVQQANIIITGHSLGGYLTQKVALDVISGQIPNYSGKNGNAPFKLMGAVTFNAPGFKAPKVTAGFSQVITPEQYKNREDFNTYPILNYVIEQDFVGNFGEHVGKTIFLKGPNMPFSQHSLLLFYGKLLDESYVITGTVRKPVSVSVFDGTLMDTRDGIWTIIATPLNYVYSWVPYLLIVALVFAGARGYLKGGFNVGNILWYFLMLGVFYIVVKGIWPELPFLESALPIAIIFVVLVWVIRWGLKP
ncbi:hypothetical protein [Geobacillus sp. DSP4a]|uniref:hypothetical protein n=1 Tax=Geobacillus sp. DSP4a TaxID=2508873 RepID=UPI0014915759|nr:hypothetical protein [Geobacillus sp. DSP4a]NNV00884.1 hypothetical protein [Geobacillus sp. DSP4a]